MPLLMLPPLCRFSLAAARQPFSITHIYAMRRTSNTPSCRYGCCLLRLVLSLLCCRLFAACLAAALRLVTPLMLRSRRGVGNTRRYDFYVRDTLRRCCSAFFSAEMMRKDDLRDDSAATRRVYTMPRYARNAAPFRADASSNKTSRSDHARAYAQLLRC